MIIVATTLIVLMDYNSTNNGMSGHIKSTSIERIVSLSPSITETLFALELGNNVVGRTRFCNYPRDVKSIPEVGGYLDLNYEQIISLKPDLVILLPEHEKAQQYLSELGINFLQVDNKTVADILNTISAIGKHCGVPENSKLLLDNIETTISKIKAKTQDLSKPKTLISIGRTLGVGEISEMYVAGTNTYFTELIFIAGGNTIFEDESIAYPTLSAEGLLSVNPDVIIDFFNQASATNLSKNEILKDWETMKGLSAVDNNRITVLSSDYISIPGPRFILLLKDIAKAIHPEIDWEDNE